MYVTDLNVTLICWGRLLRVIVSSNKRETRAMVVVTGFLHDWTP
ncbi:hypothetical protein BofuT4_uP008730.1 [Botrytis cinerea T4]|uniref:Uncharacterized protein n=1 Tax=Botryotinia fuckeliana (strain T4) TaxID=999810 RepID=G2XX78_BOTF4|nr:hypothetical protein BofuT4_uP008730.1 [Botrytis cinerea T4]